MTNLIRDLYVCVHIRVCKHCSYLLMYNKNNNNNNICIYAAQWNVSSDVLYIYIVYCDIVYHCRSFFTPVVGLELISFF